MLNLRSLKPCWLLAIPFALVMVVSLACGGDEATVAPTSAPTDTPPADTLVPTNTPVPGTPTPRPTFTPTPTAVPTSTPVPGTVIKFGGRIPMQAYSAPLLAHSPGSSFQALVSASPMWSALLEFNPETPQLDDIRGDLAKDWSVSEDGRTYTFNLYDNITWHDGTPFSSDDLMFNWDYYIDPDSIPNIKANANLTPRDKGEQNRTIAQFRRLHESHSAPDANTFVVTSKFAAPGMLPLFALDDTPIFPKHMVLQDKYQDFRTPEYLIGTGPFKFVEYEENIKIVQEKYDNYYKEGYPRIDGISHFIITDKSAIIAAYKTGQVLMGNATVNNLNIAESIKIIAELGDKMVPFWNGPSFNLTTMMNTRVAPGSSADVRKAINLVMYRQEAIDLLTAGRGVMGTPVPPDFSFTFPLSEALTMPGFREDSPGVKSAADLALAKSLVEGAGFGKGYDLTVTCRKVIEYCDLALIFKDQVEKAFGWNVSVRQMESAAGSAAFDAGEYQFAIMASSFTLPDADNAVVSHVVGNMPKRTAFKTPQRALDLVDLIARELNPAERKKQVREFNDIMLEDSAIPIWYYTVRAQLVDKRIQGFNNSVVQASNKRHAHIWCDPAC